MDLRVLAFIAIVAIVALLYCLVWQSRLIRQMRAQLVSLHAELRNAGGWQEAQAASSGRSPQGPLGNLGGRSLIVVHCGDFHHLYAGGVSLGQLCCAGAALTIRTITGAAVVHRYLDPQWANMRTGRLWPVSLAEIPQDDFLSRDTYQQRLAQGS